MCQAPHGLFVYFQRTVGGKERAFKPGQDVDVLFKNVTAAVTEKGEDNKQIKITVSVHVR